MMPLKNYTTEISAMKSIGQIQGNLVAHGASSILINYNAGKEPESLSFIIPAAQGDIPFRLPANIAAVAKVLEKQFPGRRNLYDRKAIEARDKKRLEQASKVAWRIIKDWVDAQLAIIETEMVTIEQVFLPYMLVKDGQQTLYETMVERRFLLGEGKGQ